MSILETWKCQKIAYRNDKRYQVIFFLFFWSSWHNLWRTAYQHFTQLNPLTICTHKQQNYLCHRIDSFSGRSGLWTCPFCQKQPSSSQDGQHPNGLHYWGEGVEPLFAQPGACQDLLKNAFVPQGWYPVTWLAWVSHVSRWQGLLLHSLCLLSQSCPHLPRCSQWPGHDSWGCWWWCS